MVVIALVMILTVAVSEAVLAMILLKVVADVMVSDVVGIYRDDGLL